MLLLHVWDQLSKAKKIRKQAERKAFRDFKAAVLAKDEETPKQAVKDTKGSQNTITSEENRPLLKEGDYVTLICDFRYSQGIIGAGAHGTIAVMNTKGDHKVAFEKPKITLRVKEKFLKKVDKPHTRRVTSNASSQKRKTTKRPRYGYPDDEDY